VCVCVVGVLVGGMRERVCVFERERKRERVCTNFSLGHMQESRTNRRNSHLVLLLATVGGGG